ncbi:hypothetical protein [Dyadobacter arcticus]|uniref:Uncharacterized protein n=1 Tax=Dyadobacter arcticus TaxID=1078754 RepID=A0ABX0UU34_9BACT|nr:hypothetical protein [Dyadobacter arcticus]NIJ54441.1 hypothetical protein [Dyadobacter arcticus]
MKTYMLSLLDEKPLLLILSCIYWIVFLAICWFSFDSVMQYLMYILSKIDVTTFPKS